MLNKKTVIHEAKDYAMVASATFMYACAVTLFMLPYGITTGGVAGIASIIYYATGLEVQVSYAIINLVLLALAAKFVGIRFCCKTIWGFGTITFWLWLVQRIVIDPATGQLPKYLGNEMFMACVMGGIIEGAGLAISFYHNGSTGGTDIVAAVVNKYKEVSLGTILMLCDVCIVSSSYLIFHDVQRVIFGYVLLIIGAMTLDFCMRRFQQAVEFKIYSRNFSAIADAMIKSGFGVTVLEGYGWYTKTARKVLVCICSKRYTQFLLSEIKRIDPTCFVSVTNTQSVYGEGFAKNKAKVKGQKPIIVFATNNSNKLREAREILGDRFEVRSLKEVGCTNQLPETHNTLEENAVEKARYVNKYYGFNCFADDTGLECEALDGAPGAFSARYANLDDPEYTDPELDRSKDHDSQANMRKLLHKLEGKANRNARFRTVISLIYNKEEFLFEGTVAGRISSRQLGDGGFGYDPVFLPQGSDRSFAEMPAEAKNKVSHRGVAMEKLAAFLLDKAKK